MTKCQIRAEINISLYNVCKKMARNICVYFDPIEIEFNLSNFYVYQESIYFRGYIKHNKTNCFHLDSHYTIID